MAENREPGPPVTIAEFKERIARRTLAAARSQGHPYVDVRSINGKQLIFICNLCVVPCFGRINLYAHLNGKLHAAYLATARATLLKPNPWPFNDGTFIFHYEHEHKLPNMGAPSSSGSNPNVGGGAGRQLVIPSVMLKDEASDLVLSHMGVGKISARFIENDEVSDLVRRIWCEWLGNKEITGGLIEHDFAVVTFPYPAYYHDLVGSDSPRGKKKTSDKKTDDDRSGSCTGGNNRKQMVSFSDPVFGKYQRGPTRILPKNMSRKLMHELTNYCDICLYKMLPNKDVAALLNRRTRKIVCLTRNRTGVFHKFHISCLLNWLLLCEAKSYPKLPQAESSPPKKKLKGNNGGEGKEVEDIQNCSVFCSECWGSGTNDGDKLEKTDPSFSLELKSKFREDIRDANHAWMKSSEPTENCSMGLNFPRKPNETDRESVVPLKWLHFYRADI